MTTMYWHSEETVQQQKKNKAVNTALSAYEEALFKKILKNSSPEKAQAQFANDSSLSYQFTIFR